MTCKDKEGSTHFACDCVLEQLEAADKLSKAVKSHIDGYGDGREEVKQMLATYEKLRSGK